MAAISVNDLNSMITKVQAQPRASKHHVAYGVTAIQSIITRLTAVLRHTDQENLRTLYAKLFDLHQIAA